MKLNLGSGVLGEDSPWSGENWLNVDIHTDDPKEGDWTKAKYLKIEMKTMPWPIGAESAECIWASHIFEHFNYDMVQRMFKECYRVMKPGGAMRIVCPDPRKFINNWRMNNTQFILDCYGKENWDRCDYGNKLHIGFTDMFFGINYDHDFCCSIDVVTIFLIRTGFRKVNEMSFGNTEFPQYFGSLEKTMDNRPIMSWYLEAVK